MQYTVLRNLGTVSGDGYFVEGVDIFNSTLCVFADGFPGLSKAFHKAKNACLQCCKENAPKHRRLSVCDSFQGKNQRFRVSEEGYWKDFQKE